MERMHLWSLFACAHTHPTLALQLAESRAESLAVERRNTKMLRTIECLQDWFARASRRADAMQLERDQLRKQLAAQEAALAEALATKAEALARVEWLEGELRDTQRSNGELRERLARTKKGKAAA